MSSMKHMHDESSQDAYHRFLEIQASFGRVVSVRASQDNPLMMSNALGDVICFDWLRCGFVGTGPAWLIETLTAAGFGDITPSSSRPLAVLVHMSSVLEITRHMGPDGVPSFEIECG